ncbi:MAG: peptide-methionine (S)-S-oxide reductase MsrA [Firmicutes bacterium]|nr:peptide-methionine (S)-S-oxide reductase MsrA [Bacillota bacterium]
MSSDSNSGTEHVEHSREVATLAGGCFWCLEAVFQDLRGVSGVVSGYTGGTLPNPTYDEVCKGTTGHAEVVQITYDPLTISFDDLLEVFFHIHDPTTLNRQGADIGTQYRSAIFFASNQQKQEALAKISDLEAQEVFDQPIVTEVVPLGDFYPAEAYHVNYYNENPNQPYCRAVIGPKVAKFRKDFQGRLRE